MENNLENGKWKMENDNRRVAIVSDWLIGGGAERVVEELHNLYPDAPIYTSYCADEWRQKLDNKVVTGYLQRWPFSKLRKFLPVLRIMWFSRLDLSEYDLVISSSGNGEAKFVLPRSKHRGLLPRPTRSTNYDLQSTKHVCYCHAPTHFYWRHYAQYLKNPGFGFFDPLARIGLKLLVRPLRKQDLKASKRPDLYIANSTHTKNEIKKYYNRESVVIHPPINTKRFSSAKTPGNREGFVTMGRLAGYKRVDIIVKACTKLNLPLKIIGRGPDLPRLKRIAGPNVEFLTNVSDEDMPKHLASAKAFLFAAYEDFGVAPVEAMAAGTPIIAYEAGGALDYVKPGKTGEFFGEQNTDSLCEAIKSFDHRKYSPDDIKAEVKKLSIGNFRKNIEKFVDSALK